MSSGAPRRAAPSFVTRRVASVGEVASDSTDLPKADITTHKPAGGAALKRKQTATPEDSDCMIVEQVPKKAKPKATPDSSVILLEKPPRPKAKPAAKPVASDSDDSVTADERDGPVPMRKDENVQVFGGVKECWDYKGQAEMMAAINEQAVGIKMWDNDSGLRAGTTIVVSLCVGNEPNVVCKARSKGVIVLSPQKFEEKLVNEYGIKLPLSEGRRQQARRAAKGRDAKPTARPGAAQAGGGRERERERERGGGGGGGGATWRVTSSMQRAHSEFNLFAVHETCSCGANVVVLTRTVPGRSGGVQLGFPYFACAGAVNAKNVAKRYGARAGGGAPAVTCNVPDDTDVQAFLRSRR